MSKEDNRNTAQNTTTVSLNSLADDSVFVAKALNNDKKIKRLSKYGTVTTDRHADGIYILLYRLNGVSTYLHVSDESSLDSIWDLEMKIWDIITADDGCEILTDKMKDALSTAAMKDVLSSAAKLSSAANEAIKVEKSRNRFKTALVIAGALATATVLSIYIDNK